MSEETPPASRADTGASAGPAMPAPRSSARAASGSESLNRPGAARGAVEQAVVQPVGAPLPELDGLRRDAVTAPVGRARGVVAVAPRCRERGVLEEFP